MEKMCHKHSYNEGVQLSKLLTELLYLGQTAALLRCLLNEFLGSKISLPVRNIPKKKDVVIIMCSYGGYCTDNYMPK